MAYFPTLVASNFLLKNFWKIPKTEKNFWLLDFFDTFSLKSKKIAKNPENRFTKVTSMSDFSATELQYPKASLHSSKRHESYSAFQLFEKITDYLQNLNNLSQGFVAKIFDYILVSLCALLKHVYTCLKLYILT